MDLQKVFNIMLLLFFAAAELTMGLFIAVAVSDEGRSNLISAVLGALMMCIAYGIYKLLPFVQV